MTLVTDQGLVYDIGQGTSNHKVADICQAYPVSNWDNSLLVIGIIQAMKGPNTSSLGGLKNAKY